MSDENNSVKSKRIAKNTLYLYIRMILVMLVSLYTVRVVLRNLGVEDYGIYNLIGGVVVLFSFITSSSAVSVQRFLNIALGKNDLEEAKNIYSASVIIHIVVSIILLVLSETMGLWFVNKYLVIPENRLYTANWVYQFSILTMISGVVRIPYNATVIAYEKMSFYAVMSVFECLVKLVVAFLLISWKGDKLLFYGLLICISSIVNFIIFKIYAMIKFEVCHFRFFKNMTLYKNLVSFSGWSLLSSVGSVCMNQGLNMLLNRFCGVVANAAMGIANQVNSAVYQLISNFQVAFEPQITKSYAANDRDYLLELIFRSSKFSYFLLWIFVLPLSLNANTVLTVWLTEVPKYSVIFLRLILVYSLIDAIIGPLWMVAYAIGNIRNYQIVSVCLSLVIIPLAWVLFKLGVPPYWVIILRLFSNISFSIYRLFYLKVRMDFPILNFVKKIVLPVCLVTIFSLLVSYAAFYFTSFNVVVQFFVSCIITVLANIFAMYYIGCNKTEREYALSLIKKAIKKVSGKI